VGLRFLVVPVHDSGDFEQELNGFLARHKVVSIDRHLIDQGLKSFWAICVDDATHGNSAGSWRGAVRLTNEWPFGQIQNRFGGSGRSHGLKTRPSHFVARSLDAGGGIPGQ
jgi:hypothetical protein